MIEFLDVETYTLTYQGKEWNLRKDLEYLGEPNGRQKTYIRRYNKIAIYKELKNRFPEIYQDISKMYWYDQYKTEVEGVATEPVAADPDQPEQPKDDKVETPVVTGTIPSEIKVVPTDIKMDTQAMNVLEKLTGALDKFSDQSRISCIEQQVFEDVRNFIKKEYPNLPKTLDVRVSDEKVKRVEGHTHKIFAKVCKYVQMHKNVYIYGPAGTGKNYLVGQIAEALDGKFFYASTVTQEYKLTGYKDANGEYQDTELRRALDFANNNPDKISIFMLDEADACVPDALVVINALLANGYCDFPDKRVEVGKNFVVIAAGNTAGVGADVVYTGRNVIDGATLDRFLYVKMDYDKKLEEALCPDENLRNFIYDIRKSVEKNHVNKIVGMRCLRNAYEMLVNGIDKQDIVSDAILKELGEDDTNVVKHDLDSSNEWYKYFKYVA